MLYECPDFIILDKPHNVPTVPLKGQDPRGTLLFEAGTLFPEILSVRGRNPWEGGALHRLDTATSGLVVFARTQSFYDYLQGIQSDGLFLKKYRALTRPDDRLRGTDKDDDLMKGRPVTLKSYFRSYGPGAKEVRPVTDAKRADTPVLYATEVCLEKSSGDVDTFLCTIARGFRHQIRAHLAWAGHPICGDALYGPEGNPENQTLQLDCFEVSFPLPGGNSFSFSR